MKSMTLTADKGGIPMNIIMLATEINARLGDQNYTVTIHDDTTGKEYRKEPRERRADNDTKRSRQSRRALCAGNS